VLSTLIDVMQEAVQRLDGARASASAPAPAMNGRRAPAESNGRHFDDGLEWFEAGPQRSTAAPAAAAVPATPASPSQGVPAPAAGFVPEGHRPFLGKVALVTGSGHGVGRAIAMYLARLGASVVVNSFHSRERGEQTAAEIVAAGGEAVHHWGSVTKEAHLRELFAAVEARHGGLDFFVSNASNGMIAPLEHITTEHWEKALSTNVIALHQGAMLARPLMLRRGGGKIVSLSSPGAHRPIHHFGCMGPAKAALESLTRYLAVELGSENIQVNAISAGPLYGELLDKYPDAEELVPYWESRTVNNVLGNEDGLAQMVAWMLSEVADMITGSVMDVDNGGALRI